MTDEIIKYQNQLKELKLETEGLNQEIDFKKNMKECRQVYV